MESNVDDNLVKRYYDTKDAAHLSSFRRLKKEFKNIKPKDIMNFLLGQTSYSIFKKRKYKFMRRRVIRKWAWECASLDLADLQIFRRYNEQNSYILVCYDNFSHFILLYAVKDKGKTEMRAALKKFLSDTPKNALRNIQTDKGEDMSAMHCVCVCVCARACACACVCVRARGYARVPVCVCVSARVGTRACVCTRGAMSLSLTCILALQGLNSRLRRNF